ncbi:hypothetical protein HMPREF1051_1508 [Neisseria sicca VK64]|uniref:Uncharacterized protein n=2 Tax=Neisseria sicca TaxID=490 RepID=I2NVI7_NEISI|nr:hypothetical protein HMPREF1051_1508 [Neisseria sicca VK64]
MRIRRRLKLYCVAIDDKEKTAHLILTGLFGEQGKVRI